MFKLEKRDIQRIDKFISSQLNISRKDAHKLIYKKMVFCNDEMVDRIDAKIDVETDIVVSQGETVKYRKYIYIMMNKPPGVVSASNSKGEKTVVDLVPNELKRKKLFPAGRLDKDTTGFMLITDDGGFAHKLLSPKSGIKKTYEAQIDIKITQEHIKLFNDGILLGDGTKLRPAELNIIDETIDGHVVQIVISEGKFHQVKKMVACIGGNVLMLKRTKIGSFLLDENLQLGQSREIMHKEMDKFLL